MSRIATQRTSIQGIPALVWGEKSSDVFIYVHGKIASKEAAETMAQVAVNHNYQVLSFDLPAHGERAQEAERCDVWTGMRDLKTLANYASQTWQNISLYAVSIGAYFSLLSYAKLPLKQVFLQSPIVDMEWLINQMFSWFGITQDQLREQKEIATPVETLSWDYFTYVKQHPITFWPHPTSVLYAGRDTLQSAEIITEFCERFGSDLFTAEQSEHAFQQPGDKVLIQGWLDQRIESVKS